MSMSNFKKIVLIFFTILLIFVLGSGYFYNKNLKSAVEFETAENLKEITRTNSSYIKDLIVSDLDALKISAIFISNHQLLNESTDLNRKQVLNLLSKVLTEVKFTKLSLSDSKGNVEKADGKTVNIADRNYFNKAMEGKSVIEAGIISKTSGSEVTVFATPIYKGTNVEYVLIGSLKSEIYTKLVNKPIFKGNGFSFVTDRSGNIVFNSEYMSADFSKYSIFNLKLDGSKNENIDFFGKLKSDMENRKPGFKLISIEGKKVYLSYAPVGINNYLQFSAVPFNVVKEKTAKIFRWTLLVWGGIILLVIVAAFAVYKFVSKLEKQKSELSIMNNKNKILYNNLDDIIFEMNVKTGAAMYNANFRKFLGQEGPSYYALEEMRKIEFIHPDDADASKNAFDLILKEKKPNEHEVRLRNSVGNYIWFNVTMAPILDDQNQVVSIIGNMKNINDRKIEIDILKNKAQKDALTNLFNKEATSILVDEFLLGNRIAGECAMIGIDIDNFKGINDEFGHLFGDQVLKELSSDLKGLFRDTDIIGRFGGDEFVVFLKNVTAKEKVLEKANNIIKVFSREYTLNKKSQKITASIGITFYTGSENYNEIFQKTDNALYHAKNTGKSMICVYQESKV
jgi:diguanylate cyclase (GGDEF)-like protein/PAS domain S-box-containing protein